MKNILNIPITKVNNNLGFISNILKLGLFIVLGIVLVVYMMLMFTGKVGGKNEQKASYKPTQQDVTSANETLNNILKLNTYGCVIGSDDSKGYLEVKVNLDIWKKLNLKEEKLMVEELAHSEIMLGKKPVVKIIDSKLNEHASFENNRVTLAKFDF
ncbi:MAG: hypothetical protein HQK91_09210 [Nitrospirae bacterium]|nr:hypothetical protein [Nitrospirota bacterium]MBF0541611.1 hypothetical protein [Nitrospirota bacterium]